ncbi:MAG: hypothetical protein ABW110_16230 [Steroidobacteraceae bacterium]
MNTHVCLSPNGVDIYRLDAPPRGVLVGTMDGVIELRGAPTDTEWSVVNHTLDGLHVSSVMRDPTRGSVFAGVHGEGLHRSLDGGSTWETSMRGLSVPHVFSVACDARDGAGTLYAGTEPAHVFRSNDGGDSWHDLEALRRVDGQDKWWFPAPPHTPHVKNISVDPRDGRVLYVCVEQGALLKSVDGGNRFEQLFFEDAGCRYNNDAHRVVFNPRNPDEIYLTGGDGVFKSPDGGKTWQHLATPTMRVAYPDQVYVAPDDASTLFTFGGGTPPNIWRATGNATSTVVRSRDGGATWDQIGGPIMSSLPGNLEAATMVSWPGGYGFFAGSTDGEVFFSNDRGATFARIAQGIPPVSKCVHYSNLAKGRAAVAAAQQGA